MTKPRYRIVVVPQEVATTTTMMDWFGDRVGRHGWVNLFERGIALYKMVAW